MDGVPQRFAEQRMLGLEAELGLTQGVGQMTGSLAGRVGRVGRVGPVVGTQPMLDGFEEAAQVFFHARNLPRHPGSGVSPGSA